MPRTSFPVLRSATLLSAVAMAAALAQGALADEFFYDCAIDTKASFFSQATSIGAPFNGTLIGDYNAKTNPTGTQTRPGFFGGSGNQPIPYTASFALDGIVESNPTGTFIAGLDLEALQVRIVGLEFDLLGGTEGVLPATVNINYTTFRTFSPNSLFPGGVTIPVPIGDATISELRAVQTGDGVFGSLAEQKDGSYLFTAAVPIDLILSVDVLGTPVAESTASPSVLPVSGRLVLTKAGIVFTLDASGADTQTQPVENGAFSDVPLALPTVLPTGGVANLLISGTVTQVTTESALDAEIIVAGALREVVGDLNGNGAVDAADLTILLGNWGGSGLGDLNGDGTVGAADLTALLNAWGS
jgi:hypothetical protein